MARRSTTAPDLASAVSAWRYAVEREILGADQPRFAETFAEPANRWRRRLAGDDPSPIESLVGDRIVLDQFHALKSEHALQQKLASSLSLAQACHQKQAQRRLLGATKALAEAAGSRGRASGSTSRNTTSSPAPSTPARAGRREGTRRTSSPRLLTQPCRSQRSPASLDRRWRYGTCSRRCRNGARPSRSPRSTTRPCHCQGRGCILPPGAILFASILPRRQVGPSQRDAYQQPRIRRLSPEQEADLVRLAPGRTLCDLAVSFGVSHETVRLVLRRDRGRGMRVPPESPATVQRSRQSGDPGRRLARCEISWRVARARRAGPSGCMVTGAPPRAADRLGSRPQALATGR